MKIPKTKISRFDSNAVGNHSHIETGGMMDLEKGEFMGQGTSELIEKAKSESFSESKTTRSTTIYQLDSNNEFQKLEKR